ncbi:SDR family oxidoreductase [Amycolatopsis sp. H20-H5]|uniref:SDR family oxidoreductase n=1 Tax=Amycolatopsis sp. H20-H5 TaxID=3046309 RepID=UPI002DBD9F0D|nr:SDR family oxidoreductase [Amycolatopsis sp. H20-H5]MEC3975126.1 SDR family oxidoreductase [Amycolatopsis sp. H20-H5]
MTTIKGATVLVTGGLRGLGKAFVEQLLELGAVKVYATARTPVESGDPRVVALPLEVTDAASVEALAKLAGDVSIVINNAGVVGQSALLMADVDEAKATFDANVFGVLRVVQAFAPILAANGGGALVNIHSVLSWAAGSGSYGASKAAVWSLTNSLRIELAGQGTQVVGVHLGYTDTDMISALDVPKNDPSQVARDALAAVENGETEVLADDISRQIKAALSGPVEHLGATPIAV